MSDKYYRRKNKESKKDNSINDLTIIILNLQRKIRYLEDNINLKNIFTYELTKNFMQNLIKILKILLT